MAEPERTWYRRATDGQRGYLVQRPDGREFIRSDRPTDPTEYPFSPTSWLIEDDYKPMTLMQAAQVAFEADRALCRFIGLPERAREQWANLSPQKRILWMNEGPARPELRWELYDATMQILRKYASP